MLIVILTGQLIRSHFLVQKKIPFRLFLTNPRPMDINYLKQTKMYESYDRKQISSNIYPTPIFSGTQPKQESADERVNIYGATKTTNNMVRH